MIGTPEKRHRFKIGGTPLVFCRRLAEEYCIPNLLVKDESKNPFGTFKDRRNELVIEKATEEHVDKLVLVTSGNSGYSLARLAEGTGVKVVCIVDLSIDSVIRKHLEKYAHKVIRTNLSRKILQSEDILEMARETTDEVIWDVTNNYHAAFQSIAMEVRETAPDALITPLGSGEAYVGLYEGLKKYIPRAILIGAGIHRVRSNELDLCAGPSFGDKLCTPYTPYRKRIAAILRQGNLYVHVSEKEIKEAYEKVSRVLDVEPSSAAAFASLPKIEDYKDRRITVINSGKGIWGR